VHSLCFMTFRFRLTFAIVNLMLDFGHFQQKSKHHAQYKMLFYIDSFQQNRLHYNVDVIIIPSGEPVFVVRFFSTEQSPRRVYDIATLA